MSNIILVVDIETTGFLNQGGKIVEIGIVKLNLDNGEILPAFNSVICEPGFDYSHTQYPYGWIFKNSDLKYENVELAPSLENQRDIIQGLFDEYHATAFNKQFDFGFLKDRGFTIDELPCPMLISAPIVNLPPNPGFDDPKWPKVEEAWNYFFGDTGYIEAHRGLDDAKHEAEIVYELYQLGKFEIEKDKPDYMTNDSHELEINELYNGTQICGTDTTLEPCYFCNETNLFGLFSNIAVSLYRSIGNNDKKSEVCKYDQKKIIIPRCLNCQEKQESLFNPSVIIIYMLIGVIAVGSYSYMNKGFVFGGILLGLAIGSFFGIVVTKVKKEIIDSDNYGISRKKLRGIQLIKKYLKEGWTFDQPE